MQYLVDCMLESIMECRLEKFSGKICFIPNFRNGGISNLTIIKEKLVKRETGRAVKLIIEETIHPEIPKEPKKD